MQSSDKSSTAFTCRLHLLFTVVYCHENSAVECIIFNACFLTFPLALRCKLWCIAPTFKWYTRPPFTRPTSSSSSAALLVKNKWDFSPLLTPSALCDALFSPCPPPCIRTATKLSRLQNWTFVHFALWSSCTKRDWPDWAVFSSQLLDQACSLLGRAWEKNVKKIYEKLKFHIFFSLSKTRRKNKMRKPRKKCVEKICYHRLIHISHRRRHHRQCQSF